MNTSKNSFQPSPEGAAKVRERVHLVDVNLIETAAFVSPEASNYYSDTSANKIIAETLQQVEVKESKPVGKTFWVVCHFGLRDMMPDDLNEEKFSLFQLTASFEITYSLRSRKGINKKNVSSFAVLNGPYNAWSYWREFLQNMTMRMGVPPVILDLMPPPTSNICGE